MPKRIIGVSKRLIDAAKKEFLANGFEGASIRTIARDAETSPRAVYTRFENKEELFAAVIEPVYSDFMKMFYSDKEKYWQMARDRDFNTLPEEIYKRYLDYAYSHRDAFYLILKCSKGTRFENFTKNLSQTDLKNVRENLPKIIDEVSAKDYTESARLFLENITCAFYDALFAPLVEGIPLDVAKDYITKLTQFYSDGILSGIERETGVNLN